MLYMNTNVPLHKQQIKERKIKAAENACMHCLNIIFRRIILYIHSKFCGVDLTLKMELNKR